MDCPWASFLWVYGMTYILLSLIILRACASGKVISHVVVVVDVIVVIVIMDTNIAKSGDLGT